jgi:DHA1 family inner membrane transport protein
MVKAPARVAGMNAPARVLPAIVGAQFLGVSPWFAVNAVMPDLQQATAGRPRRWRR